MAITRSDNASNTPKMHAIISTVLHRIFVNVFQYFTRVVFCIVLYDTHSIPVSEPFRSILPLLPVSRSPSRIAMFRNVSVRSSSTSSSKRMLLSRNASNVLRKNAFGIRQHLFSHTHLAWQKKASSVRTKKRNEPGDTLEGRARCARSNETVWHLDVDDQPDHGTVVAEYVDERRVGVGVVKRH